MKIDRGATIVVLADDGRLPVVMTAGELLSAHRGNSHVADVVRTALLDGVAFGAVGDLRFALRRAGVRLDVSPPAWPESPTVVAARAAGEVCDGAE